MKPPPPFTVKYLMENIDVSKSKFEQYSSFLIIYLIYLYTKDIIGPQSMRYWEYGGYDDLKI